MAPEAIVLAHDPNHLEARRDLADLPLELLRREAAAAGFERRRVRGGDDPRPARAFHHALEKHGRHAGVRDVVELELVEADQVVPAKLRDALCQAHLDDGVGQLGERKVQLGSPRGVVGRGEQVGLAHPEAAVEVDPAWPVRRHSSAEAKQAAKPLRPCPVRLGDEAPQPVPVGLLRGHARRRPVVLEGNVGEAGRGDKARDQVRQRHGGRDRLQRRDPSGPVQRRRRFSFRIERGWRHQG